MTVAGSAHHAFTLSRRRGGGSWNPVVETASAAESLALAGLFCFAFWDFYLPSGGIRPLDLLGSILLALGLFSPEVYRRPSGAVGFLLPVLCLLVISAAVVGAFSDSDNIRAAIGTCAGAGVFALFSFWPLTTRGVLRAVSITLVVSLSAFWIQFAWYYAIGTVLNFHAIVGGEPRVLSWTFRAAGLYLEPADFALMAFLLVMLKAYFSERFDLISWVTIVTMIASLSLWGILAASILVCMWYARRAYGVLALVVAFSIILFALVTNDLFEKVRVLDRLVNFASDPSATARYGALANLTAGDFWRPSFWFGQGVSISYEGFGENGLSYLMTSVGLLGVLSIYACVVARSKRNMRFLVLATLGLILTATYMWTYMFWWCWLALIGRTDLPVTYSRARLAQDER